MYRNNDLIGSHKYDFVKNGDILTVKSIVNFKITKLGIDLYKYFVRALKVMKKVRLSLLIQEQYKIKKKNTLK